MGYVEDCLGIDVDGGVDGREISDEDEGIDEMDIFFLVSVLDGDGYGVL